MLESVEVGRSLEWIEEGRGLDPDPVSEQVRESLPGPVTDG